MGQRVTIVQLRNIIEAKQKRILERGRRITQDNTEYGADLIRDTVETSGTVKSGKRGRIDTGAMLAAVEADYKDTSDGGEGRYGWGENAPFYTKFQEGGNDKFAVAFDGMFAVPDAAGNVEIDFKRDIERMLKEEW